MKPNPVYKRETTVSSRRFRMALTIMLFNGILALAALLNMYFVVERVKLTAEIQYSSFLDLYVFVSVVEFIMLMFLMPALTIGSISGERERQTLDLLMTTRMKPADIILGKMSASFSSMFILIISSFPLIAVSFVYGGITFYDICQLLLCYVSVALLTGSMGICFSALSRRTSLSTVVTYGVLLLVAAGSYAVNVFALSIARLNMKSSYISSIGSVSKQANSGGFLYLLLVNPVATFYVMINGQAGDRPVSESLNLCSGQLPKNFIVNHWVAISVVIQLAMSAVFLIIAIHAINPVKKKPAMQQKAGCKAGMKIPMREAASHKGEASG